MDEDKYRTGWKRIWAAIVDWIVFLPLAFVTKWFAFDCNPENEMYSISWLVITTFLPICYSIFCHYRFGQTIGKWVAGIRVVDSSESVKIKLYQAFLRDGLPLGIELGGLFYFGFLFIQHNEPEYLYTSYREFAGGWLGWWFLLELITMFTNYKRRALHDFMAQTVVVRVPELANK